MKLQNIKTKQILQLYSVQSLQVPPIKTIPLSKQEPNESRRVWHNLTKELTKQDYDKATQIKYIIEDQERHKEEERKKKGEVFVPKLFKNENNNWVFLHPLDITNLEHFKPFLKIFDISHLTEQERHDFKTYFQHLESKELNTLEIAKIKDFLKK